MTETIDIDIRGQICPSCLLLTLRTLNEKSAAVRAGQTEIRVKTDDRQATATIPATADRMGFRAWDALKAFRRYRAEVAASA